MGMKVIRKELILVTIIILLLNGLGVIADDDFSRKIIINVEFPDFNEFEIINNEGKQIISKEGYGYFSSPGEPLLPYKNFLIALPPGGIVENVYFKEGKMTKLQGKYFIMPSPQILFLDKSDENISNILRKEWKENMKIYYSDEPYPEEIGKMRGYGTFRKYSYVSVSICPFKYHPKSGELFYLNSAKIIINYKFDEKDDLEKIKWDDFADEKASKLFYNYEEIKNLYKPHGIKPVLKENYDYVIITEESLLNAIQSSEFIEWKQSLGYKIKFVFTTDEEIQNQEGRDLAEKIRNFLRDYYMDWGIKYVLLVGDYKTIPMRYCSPNPYWLDGKVPTDAYYADLSYSDEESWNSNGDAYYGVYGQDNPDFLAEVYVGRIPTSDASRISYTLNKIVKFEKDVGSWKRSALHGGAMLFYANEDHNYDINHNIDGASCLDAIEKDFMKGWNISHYSEHEGLSPSKYEWKALNEESFTYDWRNGQYAIVNWAAHGAPTSIGRVIWDWDDGDGIPEHDNGELIWGSFLNTHSHLEGDYPSIIFAVSCNVGYPEPTGDGNLGIDLLTKESFGAGVGICSATRGAAVSADWKASHSGAEAICYEFNHYMINGTNGSEAIGEALYDAKFYVHHNFGWDHYLEYQNMFDYNLYGDPSMVREGIPYVKIVSPEKGIYINNNKITSFFTAFAVGKIEIVANASAEYVEFYIDDVLKYTDYEPPFAYTWDEIAFFRHKIRVVAYAGNRNADDEITIWKFF